MENVFHVVLLISGLCVGSWVALNLLIFISMVVWGWIDEKKPESLNPLNRWIMVHLFKFEVRNGNRFAYNYRKGDALSNGEVALFLPILILAVAPPLMYYGWAVVCFILTLIALAYLARTVRRSTKAFNAHIKDKDAHK